MPSISNITKQYGGMKHSGGMKQKGGAEFLGIQIGEDNKNKDATATPAGETPAAVPETTVAAEDSNENQSDKPGVFDQLKNAVGLGTGDAGADAGADADAEA